MYKTIVAIGVAALFAAIPLVSSAQAISGSAGSLPQVSCASFTRPLFIGVQGSDVSALQQFLAARGYLNVSATGYFGVLTRAAVARWQADGGVAAQGTAGSGIFGPLSRAYFYRSCGPVATQSFSASPQAGPAPLTVQFTSTAPQGSSIGTSVNFGDGTSGNLAFAPTCANCNALATVTHTYLASGTYTATLTGGPCACPANGICNCPNIQILGTTTITVGPVSTGTGIQQVNAPASVTLGIGDIAEVRNKSSYFTLETLSASSATVQFTPVGCWNSFPSDPPPQVRCMIALVPIPPQTFTLGETYNAGSYAATLTQLSATSATFSLVSMPSASAASSM